MSSASNQHWRYNGSDAANQCHRCNGGDTHGTGNASAADRRTAALQQQAHDGSTLGHAKRYSSFIS